MNTSITPHSQINLDAFHAFLVTEYTRLFATPQYAMAAQRFTPDAMARKMALGLDNGTASKDGEGIVNACKHFGIPHTYKAIRAFLATR
jgi:predicted nucleotidyltransferase